MGSWRHTHTHTHTHNKEIFALTFPTQLHRTSPHRCEQSDTGAVSRQCPGAQSQTDTLKWAQLGHEMVSMKKRQKMENLDQPTVASVMTP